VAGPLTARIQKKKEPLPESMPEPPKQKRPQAKKAAPKKKHDPFYNKLRMFNGFDENKFHPTLEIRVIRDDNGNITGVKQLFRKRRSDDFEWRDARDFNLVLDNIPVPIPSADEVRGVQTEVQTAPLTTDNTPCQSKI